MKPRLRHLIVVIPGIGGSVLADAGGRRVWGPGLVGVAGGLADPGRLSVAEAPDLVATGMLPTSRMLLCTVVPGYDGLVRTLLNSFRGGRTVAPKVDVAKPMPEPDLSADVVLFPYDFRLSIVDAARRLKAEMDARLSSLSAEARRRRVIVVAHSMGGLVARYWLGPLGGAADCQALITVGTPHRGAPKALDWLVNGAHVGPVRLREVTEVLRGWPSVFDLLPRYPAIWNAPTASARYPHELTRPVFESDDHHRGFVAEATVAYARHVEIERHWDDLAGGLPELVPLFSRGHATLTRAEVTGTTLAVSKRGAEWLPNPEWAGDGTVPAISSIPLELSGRQGVWRPVVKRHGPMAEDDSIAAILTEYSGQSLFPVRGDTPDRPWLGLDLPDVAGAGIPVTVAAELLGGTVAEDTTVQATVRAVDDSQAVPCVIDLELDGAGRWIGTVPGLSPGLYEIRVRAVGVPIFDQVSGGDVLAVVDL